jgi:hypothetical protein
VCRNAIAARSCNGFVFIAQAIEELLPKCKSLSSNPSPTNKKEEEKYLILILISLILEG